MIVCMLFVIPSMASQPLLRYNPSGNVELDSLVLKLNQKYQQQYTQAIGSLAIDAYHTGISQCEESTWVGRMLRNVLPFQTSSKSDIALEALSHVRYKWPGDIQYNTVALRASKKRQGRNMLNEAYECMLPVYDMRRKGVANTSFVMPFSDEGLKEYFFAFGNLDNFGYTNQINDSLNLSNPNLISIRYWPSVKHITLLEGEVLVDTALVQILSLRWNANIAFAKAEGQMDFAKAETQAILHPTTNATQIHYNWLGNKATNRFISHFKFSDYTTLDSTANLRDLDLTPTYKVEPLSYADFDTIRVMPLSSYMDSLLRQRPETHDSDPFASQELITLATGLVDGADIGVENNTFHLNGPLDPAAFSYNKIDGFSIRERFRWDINDDEDRFLKLHGYLGFSFKLKELRYKFDLDWNYHPETRRKLSLEASCRGSGFSSKFINTINQAIKEQYHYPDSINFSSLGVDYYRHYQFQLEHSNEVNNGMMLYIGANYNYRNPVKHGRRAMSKVQRDNLIKNHYGDFSPYIRLEWTPRQYYVMEGRRKIYISSPSPTISFEAAQAIPDLLGAESDYSRLEFDIHQDIRIRPSRLLAYHIGTGAFFRQRGEYFINYRYFARHMFTTQAVEDRLGGAFQLLDDYWYSSSPKYVQSHIMFATPFGIIHSMPRLSQYVIQERFYLGNLWSEGKNRIYTEMGYGISNHYFSMGFFMGFNRFQFYSAGIKFSLEIGNHL